MFFVLLGASGAGKSVALNGLLLKHPQVVWYDFDSVGVPPNADKRWRQRTIEHWLKIALEHQSHGQDMGLCGNAAFGEYLACPSAPQIAGITRTSDAHRDLSQNGAQPDITFGGGSTAYTRSSYEMKRETHKALPKCFMCLPFRQKWERLY